MSDASRSIYRFYGRRLGRPLRPRRARLMAEKLPAFRVALPDSEAALDPATLFQPKPRAVWLEIGFGGGEHLLSQARAHPDIGMIGCEPYVNGVAALLAAVVAGNLDNVRIHPEDARPLIDRLADASVERVFILFGDPWPKARHHKRRFIGRRSLDGLARIMGDGGELRFATDDAGYLRWTLEHALRHPAFAWRAGSPADWRRRPDDWPATRYEVKAEQAGRRSAYLRFVRRPRAEVRR